MQGASRGTQFVEKFAHTDDIDIANQYTSLV